ncbi:MAG: CoA transferase [Acidimicrobiales bacterium]
MSGSAADPSAEEAANGTDPGRMLDGVRVLDFTQYLAGPTCTRLLAELGAEVIKVELPDGDPTRKLNPQRGGKSGIFIQQNRGKQSLVLDLRRPEAIDALRRLIPHVDVVVENATPGVMERRGLGYAQLSAINPRLIMVSVSGFGQTGGYAHRSCFDFIAQGMAGLMHMTGEPDGPPYFVGIGVGDVNAGVHAFAGLGYALYQRDRTGRGTHIDVSMVEALLHMQENAISAASMTGGTFRPVRQGLHYQPASPAGTFKGPEGWIVVLCMPNQVPNLWAAMGRPELADDPRFAEYDARIANRAALTELIEGWMATFATDEEVLAVLESHRVPSGPVLEPADIVEHPWFDERGGVRTVRDGVGGTFRAPAFPILFDGRRPSLDLLAPELGEHSRDVLARFGLDEEEIEALLAE